MDGIEATRRFRQFELSAEASSLHLMGETSPPANGRRRSSCLVDRWVEKDSDVGFEEEEEEMVVWKASQSLRRGAQRQGARRRLVIVGMSANTDQDTRREVLAAGMDSYLAKPFSIREFESVLQQLLRGPCQ